MTDSPNQAPLPCQLLLSGALAHLSQYLTTGCYRSAYLARMVLEQVAETTNDEDLRQEASRLIDAIESKAGNQGRIAAHPMPRSNARQGCCKPAQRLSA